MSSNDLKNADTHFRFGENWRAFADKVDDVRIAQAVAGLARLLGQPQAPTAQPASQPLAGCRLLDIGCGSGVHALAALRLGAAEVVGYDLDTDSVAASRHVLSTRQPAGQWRAEQRSVFDLDPAQDGQFDVVYSWGVLHHTGGMWEAIHKAAALVAPGGRLVLALYKKTPWCGLWRHEKRWYTQASPRAQRVAQKLYIGLIRLAFVVTGQSFAKYVAEYDQHRGMHFEHDVHDWLGGYPYESVSPEEMAAALTPLGFTLERSFIRPPGLRQIFGSPCDEYVYRRDASA